MSGKNDRGARGPRPKTPVYRPAGRPRGPLVFKKMVTSPGDAVANGAWTELRDRNGQLLGRGFLNRKSEIAFRIVAGPRDPKQLPELLESRLKSAWHLRSHVLGIAKRSDAWRWVHAEGDGLSGLIIDRYGPTAVVGLYARGWVLHAEMLEEMLKSFRGIERVLFVADEQVARKEGFQLPPPAGAEPQTIQEDGVRYVLDLARGHKTGLFLDQRDNRALTRSLAKGRHVLDLCTNTGGFALAARAGGAQSVTAVDLDEEVLELARKNARENRSKIHFEHADLFPFLRANLERGGTRPDMIVLDPPKLARGKGEVEKALGQYGDMNALAMRTLANGGLLFTFSCSGAVSEGEFLGMLRRAAREARVQARTLQVVGAAPDHPVSFDYPEGRYLKGALVQVTGPA